MGLWREKNSLTSYELERRIKKDGQSPESPDENNLSGAQ